MKSTSSLSIVFWDLSSGILYEWRELNSREYPRPWCHVMLLHGGNFGNYCFQDQIKQYSLVAFGCQCLMSNKMKRLSYGCWTRIFEFWCVISMTQKRHGSHATTPRVSNISKAPRSIILVEVVALFHMPVPIATQAEWVTTFPKAFCHVSRRSWPSTSTSTVREPGWWHLLWKCYNNLSKTDCIMKV